MTPTAPQTTIARYLITNPEIARDVCKVFGVAPRSDMDAATQAVMSTLHSLHGRSAWRQFLDVVTLWRHPMPVLAKHLVMMAADPRAQALRSALNLAPAMDAEMTGFMSAVTLINAERDRDGKPRLFELPDILKGNT